MKLVSLLGPGRDDTAALGGQLFDPVSIQGAVCRPQRPPELQEPLALYRFERSSRFAAQAASVGRRAVWIRRPSSTPPSVLASAASSSRRATKSGGGVA